MRLALQCKESLQSAAPADWTLAMNILDWLEAEQRW